jgi:hypothetical protein
MTPYEEVASAFGGDKIESAGPRTVVNSEQTLSGFDSMLGYYRHSTFGEDNGIQFRTIGLWGTGSR